MSISWYETERNKRYIFPKVIDSDCGIITSIHPLKQKYVKTITETAKNYTYVKRIFLFGSCLNLRCNPQSDLDICIELFPEYDNIDNRSEISYVLQKNCNWNLDVLWLDESLRGERIYQEILKGVVCYEQTA